MEFGIFDQVPCAEDQSPQARYADVVSQAQLADKLGYDSVWLAELHFNPRFSVMPAPLVLGGAIAQTTTRIRIGAAVHLLPLHYPVRIAEEIATLDVLSQGRAIFGTGRGAQPRQYAGYGTAYWAAHPMARPDLGYAQGLAPRNIINRPLKGDDPRFRALLLRWRAETGLEPIAGIDGEDPQG